MSQGGMFLKSNSYSEYEVIKMKTNVLKRGLLGLPIGIAIGHIITLIFSAGFGDGSYHPVTPELMETMGSELGAVTLQTVLCGVMGAGFAVASVIWELDSWSLARQSGVYFLTASLLMLPIAYLANWMEHSLAGFLSYAGIFAAIFITVWLTQYFGWKRKIKKMNAVVRKEKDKK